MGQGVGRVLGKCLCNAPREWVTDLVKIQLTSDSRQDEIDTLSSLKVYICILYSPDIINKY
jgi:hypothetical protein